VLFLLRRAGRLDPADPVEAASDRARQLAQQIVVLLGGLPLALDQAGAYILETSCGLEEYLALYEQRHAALLARRGRVPVEHPDSVGTAFALAFERVERQNPASVELLRLCAFLAPDAIPEALIVEGAKQLAEPLRSVAADPLAFNEAIEVLRSLSLVQRHVQGKTLSLHRLVQTVLRDSMSEGEQRAWIERGARLLEQAFPERSDLHVERWGWCEQLVPHVLLNADQCKEERITLSEAASLWHKAATYLRVRAQYGQAELLFQRAVHIRERILGPEHPEVAASLNGLVALYGEQGQYEQAEPLARRVLRIREQALGPEHPEVARPLNNLALISMDRGQYIEAERLYQRALHIWEQALGPEHPNVTYPLNNLAENYRKQGQYAEAEPLYRRALSIREQEWGTEHPDVATSLNNLAELYREQGRQEEAEPLALCALAIREQALRDEHLDTAESLGTLASIYRERGRYEEAEPLMQRALAIQERIVGVEHPKLIGLLERYAGLLRQMGRPQEAAGFEERTRAIRERG
ncbi:MAG: tetratricopeptide repeat protein, partial [Ktedonobacteraceae bacterium]|nr:tetratricopeptide repeat protein [Ktedonobacteraceae bacterium]